MTAPSALPCTSADGHRADLLLITAPYATATVLWLPALGVAARHYLPLAQALAARGVNVALHEWRGHGSSSWRAGRDCDWGMAALLGQDLPASVQALIDAGLPPAILGGHSLGGQLACCFAPALPGLTDLWLVAAGSPHWRSFPLRQQLYLPLVYLGAPLIARLCGHLPGRRLGFGGREARGLIADWARVGRSGQYRVPPTVQAAMATLDCRCHGLTMADDWMAPASSLRALQAKLAASHSTHQVLAATESGTAADHFAWMRQPAAVAEALCAKFP
jgi:predicted alpha/beta hydrolase